MSIRQPSDKRYCSTADVARHLRGFPNLTAERDFPPVGSTEQGHPSAADVEGFIEKWSAKMDRKTGQSWGENQVLDETHDHERLYYWLSGHPINLIKRNIVTPLDAAQGDKLEIWTGNKWEDWIADPEREEGRNGDYWVDAAVGVLFVYERAILRPHPKFRVSYRYGNGDDYVPNDIRDAVAGAAAGDIITSDFYGATVPGNNTSDNADPSQAAQEWKEEFEDTYRDYKKLHWV